MFVGKESNSSGWKQWSIGLVDKTLSTVDQAISGWFWNLINDLPRDYFAKTFDQVNYFDRSIWEGIFRARIEDIKEQLESGVSKKTFEADIIKLQGLIGKHSLSPLVYEDGLKELEDFVSDSNNLGKYLQLLANVRNEFREELRAQPLLLKECIKNDTNLGRREIAYYQSLLDSTSSKEIPTKPSDLGKSVVSKNGVTNSKLRNISKLLFCNPAQAVTLFLAGQVAFANAVSIQLNNSSAVENSTLPFENKLFNLSEVKEDFKSNISTYNALNEATTLRNVSELRLEEKADEVEKILANSTLLPFNNNITDMDEVAEKVMISPSSGFADIPEGKVEKLDVSNSDYTSINRMSLSNKVQMENATLEIVEEHKTPVQPQFEPDYPRNSTLPFGNTFISVPETKDNSTASLDTFAEDTVIKNDKHFLSANSTFEVEESVIVNTEKSSYSLFTKAFNDEIEKVKNEINKLIIALTQTELDESTKVDVRRSKRSISTNSSIIDNPNPSGSFTRSNPSSKVAKLENEMRKMKEDITQLKQSSTTSSEDKVRLGNLETTVETLQKLLDDQSKEFTQKVANLEVLVENVINVVNGLRKELDDMKKKAAEQETIQKQKGLPAECVEAIKSHNFKAAEEKLQEINDDSKINLIIKEAYNYQISNFDLVLKFGDSVRNIKRSFLTYKALNYEMESNVNKDPFKMIKLIESLRKEIINDSKTSSEIKGEAESLASSLKDSVKAVAKEKLKEAMLNDRYASVKEIADKVYNFDSTLFGNAIKEAVNDVYGRVDTEKILSMMRSHSGYIEQVIPGYAAVFDNMSRNGDLNDRAVLKLTSLVKETMEMSNYRNVDQQFKSDLENLKSGLPESIKNSVFSSQVCIKNVEYGRYLYSPNGYSNFQFDDKRGYVFTWEAGERVKGGKWKVELEGDNVYLKNVEYGRYLYSPNGYSNFQFDDKRRYVFTWEAGERVKGGKWKVELEGDNVYLKNVEYGRYLYSPNGYSNFQFDDKRRYVFTWEAGERVKGGKWKIEDCSNGRRRRDVMDNTTAYEKGDMEENAQPSSHISGIVLEKVKTTDKNMSFIGR